MTTAAILGGHAGHEQAAGAGCLVQRGAPDGFLDPHRCTEAASFAEQINIGARIDEQVDAARAGHCPDRPDFSLVDSKSGVRAGKIAVQFRLLYRYL
nr:hypothetical protein [Massilia genomosp. 1]